MLFTCCFRASSQTLGPGEGARGERVGGGEPRSRPTPALAQAGRHTEAHTNVCTAHFPSLFFSLPCFPPPVLPPFYYCSLSSFISLGLFWSLLSPPFPSSSLSFLLLRSVLPLRVPLSTPLLFLPQCPCVHTHMLSFILYFYCTFSVLDMFRHTDTYYCATIVYSIFSTGPCCPGVWPGTNRLYHVGLCECAPWCLHNGEIT